ncbi:MAG: NosD domain-containing protein [Actinomycetota bacterium]
MRRPPALAASLMVLALSASPASAQVMDHLGHDEGAHVPTPEGMISMPAEHLQVMIDETPPGGTLLVPEAVYVGTVTIDEPMTLEGEGRPVIDGNREGSVVTITAPDVTVRGLTVRRSAIGPFDSPSGLMLEQAHRALIEDVSIEQSYMGITVRLSDDVTIDGVKIWGQGVITGEEHVVETDDEGEHGQHPAVDRDAQMHTDAQVRGDGIWLWNATGAVVTDSTIDEARDGIYISYGTGTLLERNRIADSRYAVHDMYAEDLTVRDNVLAGNLSGLVLMYGGPVHVVGNTVMESGSPSTGFGVLVKDVGSVTVEENVVADNRVGVQADDAGRTGGEPTLVLGNTIAMNQIGLLLMPSADSVIAGNGFIENSTQVTMGGQGGTQAIWSLDGVGNHWSDYGGFDAEGDGTGDLAYVESGRMSELLASEPLLLALASGPAFRLLSSVEGRWSLSEPLVRDEAPLMTAPGPALRGAGRGAPVPLWIPGLVMTLGCSWLLLRARRPRRAAVR